ncbi:MAG: beta-propeller domain-containing protein [Lachnospiraceae bacterium]|nr:beta-propeller domain-containing protein [Lachnospiraceae bacterium]
MRVLTKKSIALGMALMIFAGLSGGCSSTRSSRVIPTPTPRTEKGKKPQETPAVLTGTPTEETGTTALLKPAGSYEAVYEALKQVRESENSRNNLDYLDEMFWVTEEKASDAAPEMVPDAVGNDGMAPSGVGGNGNASPDFSETNVQVEGIEESDIIKTDGKYFYILDGNRNVIHIVSAKGGAMELLSDISVDTGMYGNETGREMYLAGERLVLLISGFRTEEAEKDQFLDNTKDAYFLYNREYAVTRVVTYDISDRTAPKLVSSLEQDGRLVTSRCADGVVYVISTYGDYYNIPYLIDETLDMKPDYARYIPTAGEERISPDCIYISDEPDSERFLVLTAMSPEQPQSYLDTKAMLADGDECYVSNNYIYVGSSRWQNAEIPYNRTELYRFAYAGGTITPAGQVTVKGTLDDQFSMDEYQGHLRVVTTVDEYEYKTEGLLKKRTSFVSSERSNALYIYDDNLQLTGSIEKLAPGEQIKSARLMGNVGYFVTFRQTDPLFSVDLSDPANPKVLGALKIPGFSAYLHPFGENLLLGIGYDADENTGWTECVKLSMFDVSDPSNVKEVHKLSLPEFTYTGVASDHKAALIDASKGIIGFPARGYSDNGEYSVYHVFRYDPENGFCQEFSEGYAMDWDSELYEFKYELFFSDCRGAYIGNTFYMLNPCYEVKAYDMDNWENIGRIGLVKEVEERQEMMDKIKEKNATPVVIELEANPSTGYTWVVTTEGNSVNLSKIETIEEEGKEQLVGAPITQRYTFEVNDIGTTIVTFEYARVWEANKPLRKITYVMSVDENLEAVIESVTEE